MKKKLLEKIPVMTKQLTKSTNSKHAWECYAEIIDADGQQVLVLTMYHYLNSPETEGGSLPLCRLFIAENEDMLLDLETNVWRTSKIESLPNMSSWNPDDYCMVDKKSIRIINDFINAEYSWYKDKPISQIMRYQEKLRREQSERRYELKVARINKQMKKIDDIELPDDFMIFIDDSFIDNRYMFYKASGKRYVNMTCSHCENSLVLDIKEEVRPKHNEYGLCPSCNSKIQYIASGRRSTISDYKKIILMQKTDEGFISRYYDIQKVSSVTGHNYKILESARAVYNKVNVKYYYNNNASRENPSWWDKNGGAYEYKAVFGRGILYYKNLKEVLSETTFKYCALDILAEKRKEVNQRAFLEIYEEKRFIEYLIKMGLYNLTDEYAGNRYSLHINKEGKSPFEILKLSKQQINRLISMDGNLYMLRLLQVEEERKEKVFNDHQMHFLSTFHIDLEVINHIMKFTTISKIINYIKAHTKTTGANKATTLSDRYNNMLRDWKDYIDYCIKLKYELNNSFILFPKHFKAAHDEAYKRVLDIQNKHKDAKFKKIMEGIKEIYAYETKTYIVKVPETTGQITCEGQELHHCVGTYIDKVMDGSTLILFIRKKEDPDTPLYTMEIKNKVIVQVRGKYNCDMTPQIKQFIESFKRKKLQVQLEREAV